MANDYYIDKEPYIPAKVDMEHEHIFWEIYNLMRDIGYPETDFTEFCGVINHAKLERLLEVKNES